MKSQIIVLIMFTSLLLFCGSKNQDSKKTEEVKISPNQEKVKMINEKLEKYSYPLKGGFEYKSIELQKEKKKKWLTTVEPILSKAFKELPKKYVLVLKGHTDPTGPEFVTEDKKGNMFYSTIRAENIKKFLIEQGFSQQRIKSFGVGSAEAVDMNHKKNPKNRRVTLSFIDENSSSIF